MEQAGINYLVTCKKNPITLFDKHPSGRTLDTAKEKLFNYFLHDTISMLLLNETKMNTLHGERKKLYMRKDTADTSSLGSYLDHNRHDGIGSDDQEEFYPPINWNAHNLDRDSSTATLAFSDRKDDSAFLKPSGCFWGEPTWTLRSIYTSLSLSLPR